MPIYEYLCAKCGHEFEREQRITENPVKTCPACKSRRVKRLISQTSFVLKGSGWYADGYGNKSDDKKSDKSSSDDSSGDSAKADKSDDSGKSKGESGDSKSGGDKKKKSKKSSKSGKAAA